MIEHLRADASHSPGRQVLQSAGRSRWRLFAACRSADPDLFFPPSAAGKSLAQEQAAKAICAGCPVRRECLAFAVRTRQVHGIWGGTTEVERYRPATHRAPKGKTSARAAVSRATADDQPAPASNAGLGPDASDDEFIGAQALAARGACRRMTAARLSDLRDSVDQAASLPAEAGWEHKAAAHADIFRLLAAAAGYPAAAGHGGAEHIGEVMRAAGPAANGMITGSRQRLLHYLRAGDADSAAVEMETHLKALHFMRRLAR
jgi:WhiB family redox-sensing transcriptional regulator